MGDDNKYPVIWLDDSEEDQVPVVPICHHPVKPENFQRKRKGRPKSRFRQIDVKEGNSDTDDDIIVLDSDSQPECDRIMGMSNVSKGNQVLCNDNANDTEIIAATKMENTVPVLEESDSLTPITHQDFSTAERQTHCTTDGLPKLDSTLNILPTSEDSGITGETKGIVGAFEGVIGENNMIQEIDAAVGGNNHSHTLRSTEALNGRICEIIDSADDVLGDNGAASEAVEKHIDTAKKLSNMSSSQMRFLRSKLWGAYAALDIDSPGFSNYIARKINGFTEILRENTRIQNSKVSSRLSTYLKGEKYIRHRYLKSVRRTSEEARRTNLSNQDRTDAAAEANFPLPLPPPQVSNQDLPSLNATPSSFPSPPPPPPPPPHAPPHKRLKPTAIPHSTLKLHTSEAEPKAGPSRDFGATQDQSPTICTSNEDTLTLTQKKYEALLEKKYRKIVELEECEVDWGSDNEHNSAYLMKNRLIRNFMVTYGKICKVLGYSPVLTGRPMQKKFKLEQVTRYPEIDAAVEKLLNDSCKPKNKFRRDDYVSYAAPEYNDVLDVVNAEIAKHRFIIAGGEVQEMARTLFKSTVKMYKRRRASDLHIALPDLINESIDPAENDPELSRKLEENRKNQRNEADVLREFVKKQEERCCISDEQQLADDENEEYERTDKEDHADGGIDQRQRELDKEKLIDNEDFVESDTSSKTIDISTVIVCKDHPSDEPALKKRKTILTSTNAEVAYDRIG